MVKDGTGTTETPIHNAHGGRHAERTSQTTVTNDYSDWGNMRRRLQQAAQQKLRNSSDGMARVELTVFMDAQGELIGWEEPVATRYEPANVNWCATLRGTKGAN